MNDSEKKKTVLIVDDIPDNIHLLREVLADYYRIKIATSGEKALVLADSKEPPDLILLDIMMPGMDGYEVCQKLKAGEKTKNIPVIFVTAMGEAADEEKGFKVGAVDYLTKPVVPRIAQARVATHLALREAMVELEHQNEILADNARLRDQVERIMQHDLKTPLTAFLCIPELLKRRKDLPADVLETVGLLEKSGHRMLEIINKSLDLFRMETGTYAFRPIPVEMVKIAQEIKFELGEILDAKGVALHLLINGKAMHDDQEFLIPGDETLCYSMLANFVKNAVEACHPQETVTIAMDNKPHPRISVQNPGVIPLGIRDHFLQKFATHGKQGGTGLGGYSARLMAETMAAKVRFTTDECKGTTIIVEFGGAGAGEDVPFIETPPPESGQVLVGDLRVMAVDDNSIVLFTIKEVLRSLGLHQIFLANNAKEAQEILLKQPSVQLIISDWNIPGMNGGEFLQWVRTLPQCLHVPFLITTVEPNFERTKIASQLGVIGIIGKPFSTDSLRKKVEDLLESMKRLM